MTPVYSTAYLQLCCYKLLFLFFAFSQIYKPQGILDMQEEGDLAALLLSCPDPASFSCGTMPCDDVSEHSPAENRFVGVMLKGVLI